MKCIIPISGTGPIRRVSDDIAQREVTSGRSRYCPKALWKMQKDLVTPPPVGETKKAEETQEVVLIVKGDDITLAPYFGQSDKPGSAKHDSRRSLKGKRRHQ